MSTFDSALPAPRGLLYLASFNSTERASIAASPELQQYIRQSMPSDWPAILDRHNAAQRAAVRTHPVTHRYRPSEPEHDRQHRYASAILSRELCALAGMPPGSGRNHAAFRLVCRIGRWVHHGVVPRADFERDVLDACERNGLIAEDGRKAVLATIGSGLARSAGDALPELGARHG
jgi:hypothetical protein